MEPNYTFGNINLPPTNRSNTGFLTYEMIILEQLQRCAAKISTNLIETDNREGFFGAVDGLSNLLHDEDVLNDFKKLKENIEDIDNAKMPPGFTAFEFDKIKSKKKIELYTKHYHLLTSVVKGINTRKRGRITDTTNTKEA